MATIKEVAALAKVSIGTVSNVLNGKTNNQQLIEQVESAIRQLDYRPNGKARSLKNSRTGLVGVLVESLIDNVTIQLLSYVEKQLQRKGYSLVIRTTGCSEVLERKHAEYLIELGADAILIFTGSRNRSWLKKIRERGVPLLMITGMTDTVNEVGSIAINHLQALQSYIDWTAEKGKNTIGFILERSLMDAKEIIKRCEVRGITAVIRLVSDHSSESGFKAAFQMMHQNPQLQGLLIGSRTMAAGVKRAMAVHVGGRALSLACITSDSWIENDGDFAAVIDLSVYELGSRTVEVLLQKMEEPESAKPRICVESVFYEKDLQMELSQEEAVPLEKSMELHAALLKSEASDVLEMLASLYESKTGCRLVFHLYDYSELYELLKNEAELERQEIDLVMYDILWKDNLIARDRFTDITSLLREKPSYFREYIDGIVTNLCVSEGRLYGLPFMTGTQLLMYQRDLFEDQANRIRFRRMYGKELEVPGNWEDFNLVAEFFTRKYNPDSPVYFGTSLINEGNLYNSIDFLNRLWARDEDNLLQNDFLADAATLNLALVEYKKAFSYTDPEKKIQTWEDVSDEFRQGKTAMVVLYDSYACRINDIMESEVAGNVGSAMVPGGAPALGGWGLGICRRTGPADTKREAAVRDFLLWSCGSEISEPFSILSGSSSRRAFYENMDTSGLYPWKDSVLTSYAVSRRRQNLRVNGRLLDNMLLYDKIIGFSLGEYLRGHMTEEDVISLFEMIILNPDKFELQ